MRVPPTPEDNGYHNQESTANSTSNNRDSSANSRNEQIDIQQPPMSPSRNGDFSEYLWMENEEEFDQQVYQELEEEELMQQCLEAMTESEQSPYSDWRQSGYESSFSNYRSNDRTNAEGLASNLQSLSVNDTVTPSESKLNPDAAEFVPRFNTVANA